MANRRLENPRERLRDAALTLFAEQGLERTTVAEIAAAADVSERTFFRYFADKREVIFYGQERLGEAVSAGLEGASGSDLVDLIAAGLSSAAKLFPEERRIQSRRRRAVINSDPALRERELLKLASLADAMTSGLRRRGIDDEAAALAAHVGVAVLGVAHGLWIAENERRSMVEIQTQLLGRLSAIATTSASV